MTLPSWLMSAHPEHPTCHSWSSHPSTSTLIWPILKSKTIGVEYVAPPKGRSNMSDIDIPGYGKLWAANKLGLPLLLVFGGIAVRPSQMDGIKRNKDEDKPVQSDVYMWNYMNALKGRFHIFVSLTPRHVDGPKA
jgi:hypothetical protein